MSKNELFKTTKLWKLIQDPQDDLAKSVQVLLSDFQIMPKIEKILASASTSPTDFTLHDQNHAFRVAEMMVEIIPEDVLLKLSIYELALLLLSAYLHDIGMTPEQQKIRRHYNYLLSGERPLLDEKEHREFRDWLDLQGESIEPPMSSNTPTSEELNKATYLITHYARSKHNDWSETWIRDNLGNVVMEGYNSWIDDLILVCRSHHEGYQELRSHNFDARLIGQPFKIVHLRYLACVLRIADVLEFDPERTPEVILAHRDISESSKIYWYKDQVISSSITPNEVIIQAQPSNAYIHKAIEETVNQIDDELQICKRIAQETRFDKIPQLSSDSYHAWNLPSRTNSSIKPRQGTYEYIDSSFRPNTKRLLELLSGVELYKEPLAAVRELLQNAFDAVRERIAYERLEKPLPTDPELEKSLGNLREVHLHFAAESNSFKLVCIDDGIGMTKSIIRDYLLVSGAPKRRDVIRLERKCKEAGIALSRTGQFGVGSLSYFMIANAVSITTKRSQESGDVEDTGWTFETRGVNSFGELRPNSSAKVGTQVTLHLNKSIVGDDPLGWYRSLKSYIKNILLFLPCKFRLTSTLEEDGLAKNYGWVRDKTDFDETVDRLKELDTSRYIYDMSDLDSFPLEMQKEITEIREKQTQTYQKARQALKWKIYEDAFGSGLGRYRIAVPYFDIGGHLSLAFIMLEFVKNIPTLKPVNGRDFVYFPDWQLNVGWKGINTYNSHGHRFTPKKYIPYEFQKNTFSAIIDIDIFSSNAGSVSVDRNEIEFNSETAEALNEVGEKIKKIYTELIRESSGSWFALLNYRLTNIVTDNMSNPRWVSIANDSYNPEQKYYAWLPLEFPEVHISSSYSRENKLDNLDWDNILYQGKQVSFSPQISMVDKSAISWQTYKTTPEKIVEFGFSNRLFLSSLYTERSILSDARHGLGVIANSPEEYKNLALISLGDRSPVLVNPDNDLVKLYSQDVYDQIVQKLNYRGDPLIQKSYILSDAYCASTWLLYFLSRSMDLWMSVTNQAIWKALPERDVSFAESIWKLANLGGNPVCMWLGQSQDGGLVVVRPGKWDFYQDLPEIRKYLPEPSEDWRLSVTQVKRKRTGKAK